jgi:hypothetical protein
MIEEFVAPCLLLVEGVDELLFFEALIRNFHLDDDNSRIQIVPLEGANSLRAKIKAVTLTRGFSRVTSLVIVRDANSNPNGAFSSVCDALANSQLSVPKSRMVLVGTNPSVGVMLLPVNRPGMLEDVCLEAVNNDVAMPCVNSYFRCLSEHGISTFQNPSKSRVHAFLASKHETKRLGEAAKAGYWPWDAQAFRSVVMFLRQFADVA